MFEDTNGVIGIRKSKDRQYNCQKKRGERDEQWSTKHYTWNKEWSDKHPNYKPGMHSGGPRG